MAAPLTHSSPSLSISYGGYVGNTANTLWHTSTKTFLADYNNEISDLDKEVLFIGTHLEMPLFEQEMRPIIQKSRDTHSAYSGDAVLRHTCAAAAAEEATVHCSQPPGDAPTPEPSMWRCMRATACTSASCSRHTPCRPSVSL